jgi:hypothetical protein
MVIPKTVIILREITYEGVKWNEHAQDRVRWQNVVKTVMNLQVSLKQEIS